MFTLFWDRSSEELEGMKEVKAHYNSLKEAKAQAEHDVERGVKILRIEDAEGKTVWAPK